MVKSSIMIDLNDKRTGKIAEILSNKTAKKILEALSLKEMSEGELSRELKIRINTVGYNVKKLKEAGLIEPVKGFLWSVKGKRVFRYKVSNKRIIIFPKRIVKGILPSILVSGLLALGIRSFVFGSGNSERVVAEGGAVSFTDSVSESLIKAPERVCDVSSCASVDVWLWFLFGALTGILVFVLYNLYIERRLFENGK